MDSSHSPAAQAPKAGVQALHELAEEQLSPEDHFCRPQRAPFGNVKNAGATPKMLGFCVITT